MPYIIDNANVLHNGKIDSASLLVDSSRICLMKKTLDEYQFIRFNASTYMMTPGHVMFDYTLNDSFSFIEFKEYFIQNILNSGCTALITAAKVQFEGELEKKAAAQRQLFINSPIDYYLAAEIPVKRLSPSLLRKCKKLKISIIFLDITEEKELHTVPWGWIKDAMSAFPSILIPRLKGSKRSRLRSGKTKSLWKIISLDHGISSLPFTPLEHKRLSKEMLMLLGIYPDKGEIRTGGAVDYNLYESGERCGLVETEPVLDYDITIPAVTVHKNRVLKAGSQITFPPGYGEECFIPMIKRFG
ncbi:hypothetical protein [Metabacillus sp. RGM 3146]|uniref:hypothetical protein n=1 Tax=Metabacillus sp. RGM 3146 TaxID=3401092 RepID=UPI003B9DACC6